MLLRPCAPSPPIHRHRRLSAEAARRKTDKLALPLAADSRARMGRMAEDGASYKEEFVIRCCEVGAKRTATMETIANLLQETGCNHALTVGYSTDGFSTTATMRELGLIWVISRMHIEIYKYPAWCEASEIETWIQPDGKIGERREWILRDLASSQVIGRATSQWVMMNQETRKLQRVSDKMREEYIAYCPRPSRLAFPEKDNGSFKKIPKLEGPAKYSSLKLMPRRSDLDMNQHVNNVTFIIWVLESMPQEVIDNYELQTLTLDYRRECKHDDVVDSLTVLETTKDLTINGSTSKKGHGGDYKQFLHYLRISGGGPEISRARTIWKKVVH